MTEHHDDTVPPDPEVTEKIDGQGCVYILYRTDNAGITKVGFTSVSALSRANNYTDGEWRIHKQYTMPVWLARLTERAAHRNLQNYWLNPKFTGGTASEIFNCKPDIAESAVEIAHLEQLEGVLASLNLPEIISSYVLSRNNFSVKSELSELVDVFTRNENELKIKIIDLERSHKNNVEYLRIECKQKSDILESELKSLHEKYLELQTAHKELLAIINAAKNMELRQMIELENDLKKFSEKKINPSQFELLRENYRKALELIEQYRIREDSE